MPAGAGGGGEQVALIRRQDLASESMFVVRVGKKSYFLGRALH